MDSIYNYHGSVLTKRDRSEHMMSIEVELTNGQTLFLMKGSSKEIDIEYDQESKLFKKHFMKYTEENRLWCIAERRRLNRMMIVKDARIVHKLIKT